MRAEGPRGDSVRPVGGAAGSCGLHESAAYSAGNSCSAGGSALRPGRFGSCAAQESPLVQDVSAVFS